MKKLILFALFAMLIIPNAHAATGNCPNGYTWCSMMATGGSGCCIPSSQICDQNSCNGSITPIVYCEDLPCEGITAWTNMNDDTNRQTRCNTTNSKCEYQCISNTYPSVYSISLGTGVMEKTLSSCAECPANATCAGGTATPVCKENFYRTTSSGLNRTTYKCNTCPTFSPTTAGGAYGWPHDGYCDAGSDSISDCYIPNGQYVRDDTGIFVVTNGDCHYEK